MLDLTYGSKGVYSPPKPPTYTQAFEDWLADACTSLAVDQADALASWSAAPGAAEAHPSPDHLMPLLFAAGAAGGDPGTAQRLTMGGVAVSNYIFAPAAS